MPLLLFWARSTRFRSLLIITSLYRVWAASRGHVWTGIRGHLSAQRLNIVYNTTSHRLKSYVVQLALLLSKATDLLQGHRWLSLLLASHPINGYHGSQGQGSRRRVWGQDALGRGLTRSQCRASMWHVLFMTPWKSLSLCMVISSPIKKKGTVPSMSYLSSSKVHSTFFFFINLFIYGCVGSSLLRVGFF